MIINALYRLYDILSNDADGVPLPGYSRIKVFFALTLSGNGELLSIVDLREKKTKRATIAIPYMIVPEQKSRSGTTPVPYYLCDNCLYVLGLWEQDSKEPERKRKKVWTGLLLSESGTALCLPM